MVTRSNSSFSSILRVSHLHNSSSGFRFDSSESLSSLLEISIGNHSFSLTQQSHARAHRLGLTQHALIAQKLISASCQFKRPIDAKLIFDSLLVKNLIVCNTLLSGYGNNRVFYEAFALFREMCRSSLLPLPDDFTFSGIFKVVADFGEVWIGRMVHARGLQNGYLQDVVVGNSLLSMYGRLGFFNDASKVFDEMPLRNVSSWNGLISCYAKVYAECDDPSLDAYRFWEIATEMQSAGFKFNEFTIMTLLSVCKKECSRGRELHCYILKNVLDWKSDVQLGCSLIDMYSKTGKVCVGRRVFDAMNTRNVGVWTAMINGYVSAERFNEGLFLFREMQCRGGTRANEVSLVSILPACSSSSNLIGMKEIHGFAIRNALNRKLSLCNALIDTYAKSGSLKYASRVFDHECIIRDRISWSSIICGYSLHGHGKRAVFLFNEMVKTGIDPDQAVVVGVLSACSRSGLENEGLQLYDAVVNHYKINPTVEMCACVVDMLGRLGQLDRALGFVQSMQVEPGASIWGALLCAAVQHGDSRIQELAYASLIAIEPENSSNYISVSNLLAASKRWDEMARVRMVMKEKGLRTRPGCSWISINGATHSFFVGDKSHPCSDMIYAVIDELMHTMKASRSDPEFV
ncbi:pentatricopeptide repeat-containing protein At3g12770-like [Andrographis paniculata]|uniref:pentatricopeptide repeat-containing protein At3g12770-like n=1 Tax=Andrographis paniculata TaxID=175694 RepID=UPI0021E7DFE3|nr:pentatricopeptide repeat-containing protein At3g12770-like [Andrographis paniculata]